MLDGEQNNYTGIKMDDIEMTSIEWLAAMSCKMHAI